MDVVAEDRKCKFFLLQFRWTDVQNEFGKELVREYLEIHMVLQTLPIEILCTIFKLKE
jgi:hypothetical protein